MTYRSPRIAVLAVVAILAVGAASILAGCGSSEPAQTKPGKLIPVPASAKPGDELVATVKPKDVSGNWKDPENAGFVLELTLGKNVARDIIVPGGASTEVRVSLGAWDGGELWVTPRAGQAGYEVDVAVDPSAAGVPIMGLYSDEWWNDAPLGMYLEGDLYTYILTNEDGGTGLFPTLLMAQYGRPVDIEGLYQAGSTPTIQADGHNWTPFDGAIEGTHPLLQIVTLNGLVGPDAGSTFRVSTMPIDFTTNNGAAPREQALDKEPWILAASFAEVDRQGQVVPDGGPSDGWIGAPDDYIFIDYDFESDGAVASFEAEVSGAWWSSLGAWNKIGSLTDAHLSGVGRTCIELPPGTSAADVTALKIVAAGSGSGALNVARWFRYDTSLAPIEIGALKAPITVGDGFTQEAALFGSL